MTTYSTDDRKAMLAQIATERDALYQDIRADLAAIIAKMDAAKDAALFADGDEPQFFLLLRNSAAAYNMNVPAKTTEEATND
ncbi:MAG: hypothetical protein QM647_15040 [Asticcacaulis sp.]|uniref:hypothetical protein n=1 Tax=Asticcacaulis sp. TaxID=1872648 RepID=UPI0039E57FD2